MSVVAVENRLFGYLYIIQSKLPYLCNDDKTANPYPKLQTHPIDVVCAVFVKSLYGKGSIVPFGKYGLLQTAKQVKDNCTGK